MSPGGINVLDYDGIDDKTAFADTAMLRVGTSDFSIGCWFKPDAASMGNIRVMLAKGADTINQFYWLRLQATDVLNFFQRQSSGNESQVTGLTAVAADKWQFAIGVRSGTTLTTYLDGVQDNQAAGQPVRDITNTRNLYIGCRETTPPGFTQFWDGCFGISFLALRALSKAEVASIYNTQKFLFGRV